MKALAIHTYLSHAVGHQEQVLSIFIVDRNLTLDEFDAALVSAISARSVLIDAIHVVGYRHEVDRVRHWIRVDDNVLRGRFESLVGQLGPGVRFILFDESTGKHIAESLEGVPIATSAMLLRHEQQEVLLTAFRFGGGEQRAPTGTHYVKTSDRHADRFLRVSNVLEDGVNVSLIAYWLVAYLWKQPIRHVIVDTSGIYSVAQKLIHEVGIRGGLTFEPLLWSHRSHDGVNQIAEQHAADALFLISASSSGGLARSLVRQGASPERVVTLFLLAQMHSTQGHVLCNLLGMNGSGLDLIENFTEKDCPYCQKHFHCIQIRGDQFSIAPPNVSPVEIKATDLPSDLKPVLSALIGLRVFCAFRRHGNERVASIGVNVAPILHAQLAQKNQVFLKKKRTEWASLVRRSSTVTLRHVVACSYPQSHEVAEDIARATRDLLHVAGRPQVISSTELRAAAPEAETSTLVVSSCIDDGKELLSVSRTLRDVQENGSTAYLSVVQLITPKAEADRLRLNLTFGQHGPNTFAIHCLISLPISCYEEDVSWSLELDELRRIQSYADRHEIDTPVKLEERINRLEKAVGEGLVDDLFWPTAEGGALALRSDFSLITDARSEPTATQADLFVTMSIILAQLRMSTDASRRLSHNAYERAVLSPDNFDRFNDGVLQACLLRAAKQEELSYGACDSALSERMLNVLVHALPGQAVKERSESLMEFLIALAVGRLTLHSEHLREFCERIIATGAAEESARLTAHYLLWREQKKRLAIVPQVDAAITVPDTFAVAKSDEAPWSDQLEIELPPEKGMS
ncbi:hypothetical protein [Trinickia mobilis]|uniref:hypothetical protein n=1 Tax=Trinickia mobilis TaxID=2816356 RepID=UPI001A90B7EF|nr:hypothetical protein [Trinickia mobilis]